VLFFAAVYERPRQIKWFAGLQIVAAAIGAMLVVTVRWPIELSHLIFLLFAYAAVKGFFIWKVWEGKNWARFTMLLWFLFTYIQYLAQLWYGATPIQVEPSLKALIIIVAVLQLISFPLLFSRPANEWFRSPHAKQRLPSPS
jgi:phosphatidylserine synthase